MITLRARDKGNLGTYKIDELYKTTIRIKTII